MSNTEKMNIELRENTGKGAARQLRRDGKVPAIIYGSKGETKVTFEQRDLAIEYNKGAFLCKLYELTDGKTTFKVIPREVQLHPVKDYPLHADFLQVEDSTEVKVRIKVDFINKEKSPGLKMGGILSVVRHKIELVCKASNIPSILIADLTGKKIGDSVHISAIDLPEGVEPTITGRDFTIATIAGRAAKSETALAEEAEAEALAEEKAAAAEEAEEGGEE